ncbi:hypothetical protein BY996DRAFT_1924836 [Phakopsora pachyrhizi]|nr:hypothetical protein BY996DRAFT_1924836 [Phakopsora pachyrhizi]
MDCYSRYQVPYISIPRKPVWLKQVLKKSMVSNGSSAVKFLIKNNDIDTVEKNHGIDQQFDNSNSNHNRQFDKLQQRKIGNLDDDESLKTPRSRLRPEIRINDDNDDSKNEFKPIFVTRADCLDSKHDQGGLYPVKKPEIRNVIEESDLMSEDPELAEELEEKMEIKRAKVEKIQLANFKARPIQSSVQLKTPTDPKNMSMRFETKANDKLEIRDEFTGQRCINNSNNNSSMDQRSGVGDQKVKQKSTSLSSSISSSPPTSKSFVDSKDDRISKTALGISSLTRTYSSNRKHCRNLQQPQQQPRSTKNTTTELKEDEMKIIAQQKQQQGVAKKTMNTMIITEASFKSRQPNILADDLIKNQKLLHRQDSVDEITKKSEGQGKQEKDLIGQDGKEELKSKGNINDNKESKKSQREPESGVNRDRDRYRTNDKSDEYEGVVDEEEVVDDEEYEGEDGINENFIIEIPIAYEVILS